jgi:hypothetical protein
MRGESKRKLGEAKKKAREAPEGDGMHNDVKELPVLA